VVCAQARVISQDWIGLQDWILGLQGNWIFATVDYRHKDAVQLISFTAFPFANSFSDQ
jgi:hypothetical protein